MNVSVNLAMAICMYIRYSFIVYLAIDYDCMLIFVIIAEYFAINNDYNVHL